MKSSLSAISVFVLILSIYVGMTIPTTSSNLYLNSIEEISNNTELENIAKSGVGTSSDPYIIEDFRSKQSDTMLIKDTTMHFVIQDIIFEKTQGVSLHIQDVAANTVTIQNNTFRNNHLIFSILIDGTSGVSIENNVVRNSTDISIYVRKSIVNQAVSDITIRENRMIGNFGGVLMTDVDDCLIEDNLFQETGLAISLAATVSNCVVTGNTIIETNSTFENSPLAKDNSTALSNTWDGNYWSNYDIIAPTGGAYEIQGAAGAFDNNPQSSALHTTETNPEEARLDLHPLFGFFAIVAVMTYRSIFRKRSHLETS